MPPAPTTRPSTRKAAPNPSMKGPSWTRRTSSTGPTTLPSMSTTSLRSSSPRRTVIAPRDVADDVIAHPLLGRERRHLFAIETESHSVADVGHAAYGNANGVVGLVRRCGGDEAAQPVSQPRMPGARQQGAGPAQQCRNVDRTGVVAIGELDVVNLAAELVIPVDKLTVEQLQGGVHHATFGLHAPPFVMIIRGMVTIAITSRMTRYTVPRALAKRPLTCSPM